jgi:predicted amidophosphoribosyltransferase
MLAAELVALVVPPRCAACRAPGRRAADVLCGACRRGLPWLAAQQCCPRCALPLPHRAEAEGLGLERIGREGISGRGCPARDAPFDVAWSAVAYEGVARDAMHALKFSAARPLAEVMAAQIAANVPAALLAAEIGVSGARGGAMPAGAEAPFTADRSPWANAFVEAPVADLALVAVPAHPVRRRTRGFDPAELLARALARRTGLPLTRALTRRAAAQRQLGASRDERRAAGRLGFEARGPAPRTAILVDDVHTTGATLSACAQALKDAGAQRVVALTWARTL